MTLYKIFGEAMKYDDEDMFVAEWSTSSEFIDEEGNLRDDWDDDKLVDYLREVYTASHISVKEIRERVGLTQAALSEATCIPKRSIENWETGKRDCPPYVRLMLAQIAGLVYLIDI